MPGSTTAVFDQPDDYEAALRSDGRCDFLVTTAGEFRAQLTRIELPCMHLVAGNENRSRIAFMSQPRRLMRISLPVGRDTKLFRDGAPSHTDEVVTHTPGQYMHERTEGPSLWRVIWFSARELSRYGHAMVGSTFDVPLGMCRWRPARAALKRLSGLHDDAVRMNRDQPLVLAAAEATRGLQQELIDGLVECLLVKADDHSSAASPRHADIMRRFQAIIRNNPKRASPVAEICAALNVPERTLHMCCNEYLGVGPRRYLHLRQMQRVRRALRGAEPGVTRVSDIAREYGFVTLGRFASAYREQFGELPSATMRRRLPR